MIFTLSSRDRFIVLLTSENRTWLTLKRLAAQWPYWGFFLNQVDDSIKILGSCCCGVEFPGRGAVLIDPALLPVFLNQPFAGMNALFDQHGFPEHELEAMSMGLVALTAPSD